MSSSSTRTFATLAPLSLILLADAARAHEHHADVDPEGPLDVLILLHISIQFFAWYIMFPVGLVYGFARARWHVPLQATGFVLTAGGYVLGHKHAGRTFPASLHGVMATFIIAPIALQLGLGSYLKLHIDEGTTFRSWAVFLHRLVGLSFLPLGWIQGTLGILVLGNVCPMREDVDPAAMARCVQPFFVGTALIQYGIYSYLFRLVLPRWRAQSPDLWESLVLCISGVISFGLSHSTLIEIATGILMLIGGIVSAVMSRSGRRTIYPSLILIGVGILTITSGGFILGIIFLAAAAARITDIVTSNKRRRLKPMRSESTKSEESVWNTIFATLFLAAGLSLVTSGEEMLKFTGMGPVLSLSYLAFMLGLVLALSGFLLCLGHLYRTTGQNALKVEETTGLEGDDRFVLEEESDDEETSLRRGEAFELHEAPRKADSEDETH